MAMTEQGEFGKRLTAALEASNVPTSPTKLARMFNLVADKPVTVHAVRKWLMGESIPTHARIRLLAEISGADLQWLRFGAGAKPAQKPVDPEQIEMAAAMGRLQPHQRRAVLAVVRSFGVSP